MIIVMGEMENKTVNLSYEFLDIYIQIKSLRQRYHEKISLPDVKIGSLKGLISFPRNRIQTYLTAMTIIPLIAREMGRVILKRGKRKVNTSNRV